MGKTISFSMDSDLKGLQRKFSTQRLRNINRALTQRVAFDSNRYVKVDTGDLKNSAQLASDQEATWNTPYARYAYYTGTPNRSINPLASLKWFEAAKAKRAKQWAELVKGLVLGG
ncbi:minor capsid protein [uncultured Olegusella sp.]|uniref:minor capsid protein n=1 Tax=uncultured Olegusella sp. TaxID=1979846 RepID=UPI0026357CEB|nr:minor capsid protein [uncultured Olegusella sp.]